MCGKMRYSDLRLVACFLLNGTVKDKEIRLVASLFLMFVQEHLIHSQRTILGVPAATLFQRTRSLLASASCSDVVYEDLVQDMPLVDLEGVAFTLLQQPGVSYILWETDGLDEAMRVLAWKLTQELATVQRGGMCVPHATQKATQGRHAAQVVQSDDANSVEYRPAQAQVETAREPPAAGGRPLPAAECRKPSSEPKLFRHPETFAMLEYLARRKLELRYRSVQVLLVVLVYWWFCMFTKLHQAPFTYLDITFERGCAVSMLVFPLFLCGLLPLAASFPSDLALFGNRTMLPSAVAVASCAFTVCPMAFFYTDTVIHINLACMLPAPQLLHLAPVCPSRSRNPHHATRRFPCQMCL